MINRYRNWRNSLDEEQAHGLKVITRGICGFVALAAAALIPEILHAVSLLKGLLLLMLFLFAQFTGWSLLIIYTNAPKPFPKASPKYFGWLFLIDLILFIGTTGVLIYFLIPILVEIFSPPL